MAYGQNAPSCEPLNIPYLTQNVYEHDILTIYYNEGSNKYKKLTMMSTCAVTGRFIRTCKQLRHDKQSKDMV